MKRTIQYFTRHKRRIAVRGGLLILLSGLLLYRLGTLTVGLSPTEVLAANAPLGWHGLYNHPFYLPLLFVRSAVYFLINDYGDFLTRLPNTLFGLLSVISLAYVVRKWHGIRTAVFATTLYGTSAWFLHVSRLASFDVLYLCAIPMLLCSGVLMQKYFKKPIVFYGSLLLWGAFLYVPGLIWLILLTIYWQKEVIAEGWKQFSKTWQRALYVAAGLIWLPLLLNNLARPHQLMLWFGAPSQFAAPLTLLKSFVGVFVHLFVRGPQYPEIWLGKLPIMDIFVLVACVVGIYFYARNKKAFRSRQLFSYFVVAVVLITLHGAVPISLLIPLLYLVAATGVAFLLREWLQIFPNNPFARGLGIALITIAVLMSSVYNLRAYFVAWPHNPVTQTIFRYDR